MKVFLSWSGGTSHELARIFRDWLPLVLQYIKPYVSSEDIDKGARWLTDIVRELETSYYGVLFITKENVDAAWLNFEAGALAKAVQKSRVTPFLFDLAPTDFSGPLTQFQAVMPDELDVFKLLISINRAAGEEQLDESFIKKVFEKWWPDLDRKLRELEEIHRDSAENQDPLPSEEERLLREILELSRGNQSVLRTPEILFPFDYFKNLVEASLIGKPTEASELLQSLERRVSLLQDGFARLVPKIRNVSKAKVRNVEKMIDDLKDPIDALSRRLVGK